MSIGNDVRCALSVDENAAVTAPLLFMVATGLLVVANFTPDLRPRAGIILWLSPSNNNPSYSVLLGAGGLLDAV